jgi:glycosyltransferase involved in cell wall biosynthesis
MPAPNKKIHNSAAYNHFRREIFNLFERHPQQLYYITEKRDWSIKWDGTYLTNALNEQHLLKASIGQMRAAKLAKNKILHFGSRNLYLPNMVGTVHRSNKVIFTWFHGTDEDTQFVEALPRCVEFTDLVHTSCNISQQNLIRWGIPEEKLVVIPLGVDIQLFQPISEEEKKRRKLELNLPEDKTVIGSFQKDGAGWTDGLEPKYIKGPDVFCDTCIEINRHHPVHALLTGPARGYVKKRLKDAGITYTHICLDDFTRVAWYYPLTDICLISSRAEGGPKALLEGMACGVPVVSTRVGMSADLIRNGQNAMISEIEDVESLCAQCIRLIENDELRSSIVKTALEEIPNYTWNRIAGRYYNEIYKPFLSSE